ncbi:hypothetical protein [Actinomyces johnsonii]|uniref:phosphatase domain-containing protein n=1 Tax=Actinomyces johnsonii TaxID=544581 RepID=UPI0036F35183
MNKRNTFIRQWDKHESGVIAFPSGARIRGRPIRYYKTSRNSPNHIACRGGVGRAGTELACIAILDGMDPVSALNISSETHTTHGQQRRPGSGGTSQILHLRPHSR